MVSRPSDYNYYTSSLYYCTRPELTRVKKVVVQSFSKEEIRLAEKDWDSVWSIDGLTQEDIARTESLLSFEVVREEDL